MGLVDPSYRFACASFAFCLAALAGLLALWLVYMAAPAVSAFDLGSPQLRAFV